METYWLPPLADWPTAIGAVEAAGPSADAWSMLVALAGHRLNFIRLGRLDRTLERLFGDAPPPGYPYRPVRLAVLGSSTTSHLLPAIRVAALRRGLWVTIHEGDFGQYRQELLDPGSTLHSFQPTAVLLALDSYHLAQMADPTLSREEADAAIDARIASLRQLWDSARTDFRCQVIQQAPLAIVPPLIGSNEHKLPGSAASMIARLAERLRDATAESGVDLLALDAQAAQDGIRAWHDPMLWHRAKQEVSPTASPIYGELVARLLAAAQGRSAKCLVLDLDNTVWGGVIGDDGIDGIVIGQGSAVGEAFAGFQSYAASLARRGVILAVCSKNDEANAFEPFDRHPDMILRRKDVSAFYANWQDKPSNLRAIAQSLNIGLDALVFADDNPFERALVRRELPMVAVPELPEDPALYARCIADAGYFETLAITAEDRERTHQYTVNRERQALLADATDMGSYLRSLEMQLIWSPFDALGLKRVSQLINKTNQFNLTTRRYGEDEVAAVMDDPRAFGVQLRLLDRFGDNGIIAVVIGRVDQAGAVELDTWLMSCRVLGRRVEEATLAVVMTQAERLGAKELIGRYVPSAKNGMVADHYLRLGFIEQASAPEGVTYRRALGQIKDDVPIEIVQG